MAGVVCNSLNNLLRNRIPRTFHLSAASTHYDGVIPEGVLRDREKDLPVELKNPFEKPKPQCILCKHKITPDYKNVQLLSQFVSPYTGRIYGRHITGLCEHKQAKVEKEIVRSRKAALMAYYLKDPVFFKDPKLYDPENPLRPHRFN